MNPMKVGLLGLGVVGGGTWTVLSRNAEEIARRAGRRIEVTRAAVRDVAKARARVGDSILVDTDVHALVRDPEIDIVVELIGGDTLALELVMEAIANGKHVVTANKALLAKHGNEIFAAAYERGVMVTFEAAVAGGIPIIKAIREGLTANRIQWVAGIINGTTNFILSRMRDDGLDFASALAEAQALGYAEADPTFDIEGIDAAHKITLLAANAFGMPVCFDDVQVEGISRLQGLDVACAEQLGFRVKLLGIARRHADGVELRVQPALVPSVHLMAHVERSMNAVMVKADAAGVTMYYGAGAGSEQTASAVIADLVDVARMAGTDETQRVPHLGFHAHAICALPVLPRAAVCSPHYLRVPLHEGRQIEALPALLAAHKLPVRQIVLAAERAGHGPQALVLTDMAPQGIVDVALHALQTHPVVAGAISTLRVEELAS